MSLYLRAIAIYGILVDVRVLGSSTHNPSIAALPDCSSKPVARAAHPPLTVAAGGIFLPMRRPVFFSHCGLRPGLLGAIFLPPALVSVSHSSIGMAGRPIFYMGHSRLTRHALG